eukprot:g578.t1
MMDDVGHNDLGFKNGLPFKLLPELLASEKNYENHAVGKWHLGHATRAYTPTYRGYRSFLGYYDAMTQDYWAHTHATGGSDCAGPGLGGLWNALSNATGADLRLSADNGTYESTLYADHAIGIIDEYGSRQQARLEQAADDDSSSDGGGGGGGDGGGKVDSTQGPLFMYIAFHNEAIDAFNGTVVTDVYKVTAAQIATMDESIGRILDALDRNGMLDDTVVGMSSDNGGPLDHANNWPLRGGKHTYYEGGLRTQALVWAKPGSSHLLPDAVRGTHYDGLMHVADWRATYATGLAGIPAERIKALDRGAYPDESKNHWDAIVAAQAGAATAADADAAADDDDEDDDDRDNGSPRRRRAAAPPRTELIHSVHSPAYYPGNCSMRSGGKCGLAGFAQRCDAPGLGGRPTPTKDDPGGCLHGCLFNVTADREESRNLFKDPAYAADVARLKAALDAAGASAPPWFQVPAQDLGPNATSPDALNAALCAAAHRAGGVAPIDF